MLVSLVMATVGRTVEMARFLESARTQSHREFEILVVDQNPDQRLLPVLAPFHDQLRIRHLHSEPGVSRARNVGLAGASGEIVGFPDDDCWYEPDLLSRVVAWFAAHPEYQGLTGRALDERGAATIGPSLSVAGPVQRDSVWRQGVSAAIFLRRCVIDAVGGFREELGAGSGTAWGAAEETELLLRTLAHGFRVYYDPGLTVRHPAPIGTSDENALRRVRLYSGGVGRVLRLQRYPAWIVARHFIRPLAGCGIAIMTLNLGRARFYWTSLRARVAGFRARMG